MKSLYTTFFASLLVISTFAQVEITSANLPQADNILVTQNATLLTEVDLEMTGENVTWDFGPEILMYSGTDISTTCYDVDDTPIAYQFLFNNPFDPAHNSDFGQGIEAVEVGTFTFEDAYQYYQNNSTTYAMTGMGVSISGLPIAAQAYDPDVIYDLPLNYADTGFSQTSMEFTIPELGFWGLDQDRTYEVDGWGTLLINGLSIEVIRYRSVIHASDSLYSDLFSFGTTIDRPETIEYKWLSPQYNVPVLQINTSDGFVTTVLTANIFESSVEELAADFHFYPNPATEEIRFTSTKGNALVSIFDMKGALIENVQITNSAVLDVRNYPPGAYTIRYESGPGISQSKFIKL